VPRQSAFSSLALLCVLGLATILGGCSAGLDERRRTAEAKSDGGWFSKSVDIFAKPEWASAGSTKNIELGPKGPVGAEELVNADGSCAPEAVQASAAAMPAGDLAGAPMPGAGDSGAPPVLGGIALGMTECQAVRRAGTPGNVAISADDKGERRVVLTYLNGPWPGIYTFSAGRLKVVERAPEPPKPVKPAPKKKPPAKPRVSQSR
jgi:hypothetical protein